MSENDNIPPLRVGDLLHGFCGGYFGRDAYDCKRVEAIGFDWVVARSSDGRGSWFASVNPENLTVYRQRLEECGCYD